MGMIKSIRSFIGAKNYEESVAFYKDMGFKAIPIGEKMTYFKVNESMGFYLQDYNVKEWVDNSMLMLEVENLEEWLSTIQSKKLEEKYPGFRLTDIKIQDWGSTFFLHDPSGILWHFTKFNY